MCRCRQTPADLLMFSLKSVVHRCQQLVPCVSSSKLQARGLSAKGELVRMARHGRATTDMAIHSTNTSCVRGTRHALCARGASESESCSCVIIEAGEKRRSRKRGANAKKKKKGVERSGSSLNRHEATAKGDKRRGREETKRSEEVCRHLPPAHAFPVRLSRAGL